MLGTSRLIIASPSAGSPPSGDLSVFVSPSSASNSVGNGSWTSPTFTASVSGGTKPYSYSWSATRGTVIDNGASANVRLSGYNEDEVSELTCTVTDDNGDTAQDTAGIVVFFGDQLR